MAEFHIDHDVSRHLAPPLTQRGYYAVSAYDLGPAAAHDGIQLMAAAQRGRILVSHNWKDFRLLHLTWQHWAGEWRIAQRHAGILIVPQRVWTVDQMAQELDAFVSSSPPLMNTLQRWVQGRGWAPFP